MKIEVDGYTAVGSRNENEDTAFYELVGSDKVYAVVADGLGGHGGGKKASEIAVQSFKQCGMSESLPDAGMLTEWMEQANNTILKNRLGPGHMKTTVVFLCVRGNQAVWAHVGDSRMYHYYNGELSDVTLDHSVSQLAVMMGDITREQIPGHVDRSSLLRAIGGESIEPEIHEPVRLMPGQHAFLLCSDGFWERLDEKEIPNMLKKSESPGQWLERLKSYGEKKKNYDVDNNTAIAVFCSIEK